MRSLPALLAAVLLAAPAAAGPGEWTAQGATARAPAPSSSDGEAASLTVRCRRDPEIRLTHPALALLPEERGDRREGWRNTVQLRDGFGLDLARPDHGGALSYWLRCADRPDCLAVRERDLPWVLKNLKSQWTWHIRIEPPGGRIPVDLRFSLAGSRRAIEAACPAPGPDHRLKKRTPPPHREIPK